METNELHSEKFKRLRKKLGLFQWELAERLGIGPRQYQNYEGKKYDTTTNEEETAELNRYMDIVEGLVKQKEAGKIAAIPMEQPSDIAEKLIRLEAEAERLQQMIVNVKDGISEIKFLVTGRQS